MLIIKGLMLIRYSAIVILLPRNIVMFLIFVKSDHEKKKNNNNNWFVQKKFMIGLLSFFFFVYTNTLLVCTINLTCTAIFFSNSYSSNAFTRTCTANFYELLCIPCICTDYRLVQKEIWAPIDTLFALSSFFNGVFKCPTLVLYIYIYIYNYARVLIV